MARRNRIDDVLFWCVTTARPTSELCDIVFEASPRRLVLQGAGGLLDMPSANFHRGDDRHALIGVYESEADALTHARAELARAKGAALHV